MLRAVTAEAGVTCIVIGVSENTVAGSSGSDSGPRRRRLTTETLSVTVSYQLSYGSQT